MFQHVVVPVDGSTSAWKAVPVGARMAAAVDGKLDVVSIVDRVGAADAAEAELAAGLERLGDLPVGARADVVAGDSVADSLAEYLESRPGAIFVMSSHGHGRSAAVLGSVADELLRATFGPMVVLGPHVSDGAGELGGRLIVPLDGSEHGEAILSIASAWVVEFGGEPWLLEVVDPGIAPSPDYFESAYASRRARRLTEETGHEFEFDVLHHEHPATAITEYAARVEASIIFATTHGRTGVSRLRLGSVASDIVRHSTCPVVLYRPPELGDD